MKKLIDSENLVKTYGEGSEKQRVLDGVSVSVGAGEFISVMGPSGSGKSTLMYALSGMDRVDSGKVIFDGQDITNYKEDELADIRRRKMGFVFQQPAMLKNLNILDNIILPAAAGKKKKRNAELAVKARELMERSGISGLEKRGIDQVSGGQLQRAGICRALIENPEIIFGDEPTGALNSKSAQEIMDIFLEINEEGTTVILVTHDVKVAACAERILFMCDGKIVSEMQLPKYHGDDSDKRIKSVTMKMREIGI